MKSLDDLRDAKSNSEKVVAMKGVMKAMKACLALEQSDGKDRYLKILAELLFLPESAFMHKCYLSHIRLLPVEVQERVMRDWVERVEMLRLQEPMTALEILHSLSSMGNPAHTELSLVYVGLHAIAQLLQAALQTVADGFIPEETEKILERVSTMGYCIIQKCSNDMCKDEKVLDLMERCSVLTVTFLKVCRATCLLLEALTFLMYGISCRSIKI